jgi:type IV pilus assembly protein PilM
MSLLSASDHFGLDVGTNSIRLVQLGVSGSKYVLKSFGFAPLPAGLTQSDSKLDMQKIAQTVEVLIKQTGTSTKNVVSAIPGTSTFTATIDLPPMSHAELEKSIKYQAEQNIPVKLDDVKYDYQIIKEDPQTKELRVMIIAATKTKVNQQIELMGMAKLNVLAMETSSVAMARSLNVADSPNIMILDIGATTSEIAILEKGILTQTRSFPLAGYAITRAISQQLGLDIPQAEQFKQRFGLAQDKLEGQVYKASEPIIRNILDEAIRSAKFYEEQSGSSIHRVVLTGGSSRLPLLLEFIKTYMGVEVMYGNPWSNVSYPSRMNESITKTASEFATAVGLAMRQ